MKRTVESAREAFQFVIPSLSDHWVNKGKKLIADAEAKAKENADQFVEVKEQEAMALRDSALRELTATRDEMDQLTIEGARGRMPAGEYSERLRELRTRQTAAEGQLQRVDELAGQITVIEDDPIAWFDELTARTKQLQDFPW